MSNDYKDKVYLPTPDPAQRGTQWAEGRRGELVGLILENLETGRGVAGDERVVVERVDEVAAHPVRLVGLDGLPALVIGGADDRALEGTRYDLLASMQRLGVVQDPVDRERPALHRPTAGPGGNRPGGGQADFQQIVNRMPAATLADFKKDEAVMIVATEGTTTGQATAITVLGGVEPILAATPTGGQAMTLSPWSLGGAPAVAGDTP